MRPRIAAVCFALLAATAAAQTRTIQGFVRGTGGGSNGQVSWGTAQIVIPTVIRPAVTGAPFSGEESETSRQVLADGTRITRPGPFGAKVFRDTEGRTRLERRLLPVQPTVPGRAAIAPIELVEINDPAQGIYYILDATRKVAYRFTYTPVQPNPNRQAPRGPAGIPPGSFTNPQGIRITTEDLGLRVINGVQAEGRRRTTVTPENFQGNDRPLTQVNEDWTAVQLQIPILSISTSAQSGESRWELLNVGLASPSPVLFSPPPDFTIQDKQSPFTVEFGQRPAGAATGAAASFGVISVGVPVPPGTGKQ